MKGDVTFHTMESRNNLLCYTVLQASSLQDAQARLQGWLFVPVEEMLTVNWGDWKGVNLI